MTQLSLIFCKFWRQKQWNCSYANIRPDRAGWRYKPCSKSGSHTHASVGLFGLRAYLRYQLKRVSQTRGVFSPTASIENKGVHLPEWNQADNVHFAQDQNWAISGIHFQMRILLLLLLVVVCLSRAQELSKSIGLYASTGECLKSKIMCGSKDSSPTAIQLSSIPPQVFLDSSTSARQVNWPLVSGMWVGFGV